MLSKREIFEQYLNRVYYGNGAWGAEAAARFYFGKPAAALSLGEGAFLAVLPRGPEAYDPFRHFQAAVVRRRHILGLMQDGGLITPAARDVAEKTPLVFRREHPELRAPHFVEHVLAQLDPGERAGATIETTLDRPLQQRLEIAVRDHLEAVGGRGISQAGVVVIRNRDGAVLAMVGSRDYFDARHAGAVNVTTIRRRPGSTLKPFVYGLALEAGDSPATLAYDVVLPGETRETYTAEVKQHGAARYRESLAGSYNLAAVHTLARVGTPALVQRLRRAGLTTLDAPDETYPLSLAIGEAEFRIIEYTGAFAAFGNGGAPWRRARSPACACPAARSGSPRSAASTPVFRPDVAFLIFDILSDPDARRPMFGSSAPMNLDFPVALKTGTTRAYTDDLAFGTTAEYTVGAWGGNFDGSPTAGVMAMQGAAPLVRSAFVALAARFGPPTAPARPPALERGAVCALSGMLPGPDCPHKHETFVAGTRPHQLCTWHRRACGRREVKYPPEVAGWARVHGLIQARAFDCPKVDRGGGAGATLAITYPADGARFLLDPERPPTQQQPPLRAIPARASVRWTVDGVAADCFVPSPGDAPGQGQPRRARARDSPSRSSSAAALARRRVRLPERYPHALPLAREGGAARDVGHDASATPSPTRAPRTPRSRDTKTWIEADRRIPEHAVRPGEAEAAVRPPPRRRRLRARMLGRRKLESGRRVEVAGDDEAACVPRRLDDVRASSSAPRR